MKPHATYFKAEKTSEKEGQKSGHTLEFSNQLQNI